MADRPSSDRARRLLAIALSLSPENRAAFLSQSCSGDPKLRAEVDALIESMEEGIDRAAFRLAQGTKLGRYEIVDFIAASHMSEVYKARDIQLNRTVVIKTLRPDQRDDPERRERFEREAQAIAALKHRHICVLYDVGRHDGIDYLVMEYLEGETLATRLERGPLPIPQALSSAIEITDALESAHAHGIIHRDLKPGNVMLTKGGVKLLDFGLAKVTPMPAGVGANATALGALTREGVIFGTLPYMAPEQLRGEPADERSDIFAFGAVLYEMLSGERAFGGNTGADLVAAILSRDPEPLGRAEAAIPPDVDRLVRTCLAKDPDARWQRVSDVGQALRTVAEASGSDSGRHRRVARWAAVIVVVSIAVWVSGGHDEGPTDPLMGSTRVAVLPFENLTPNRSDDWLAGAFSDSITAGLADVESLICISRDRIVELYRQRGIVEAAPVAASTLMHLSSTLGVRYYVHGSYQKLGNEIKVVARLVDGRDGSIRAQESVTDAVARLLAVQDELANRFSQRLAAGRRAVAARTETSSLEAYRAMVEARVAYASGTTPWEAHALLQRAVELDPRYAQAWALLAKTKARMSAPGGYTTGPLRELRYAALADARRAVALDPALHEAYVALALAHRETEQTQPWRAAAEQAIALNPRMAEAYALLADSYAATPSFGCSRDHDARRAETNFRTALRLDPLLAAAWSNLAHHLVWNGQVESALGVTDEALRSLPGNLGIRRARTHALVLSGRLAEADDEARAMANPMTPPIVYHRWLQATIALKRGATDTAGRELDAILASVPETGYAFRVALSYFMADQPERALTLIDGAIKRNRDCATFAATSPAFAHYRDLPAFRSRLASWNRPPT